MITKEALIKQLDECIWFYAKTGFIEYAIQYRDVYEELKRMGELPKNMVLV